MDWQTMSTIDHARKRFKAALLPIGTLEAHDGGPVGTDNLIPEAFCQRLSPRLEVPCLPVMPYGITSSLLAYPGGCTLSEEVLTGFLYDIGKSLHRHGLKQLIVINGHGGNTEVLREAAGRLFQELDLYVAVIDWWYETSKTASEIFGEEGLGHAAIDEMGALLGLCPELREKMSEGPVPSYHLYRGTKVYPAPRPVLTYRNPEDIVDYARLTPECCERFVDISTDILEKIIIDIRDGWNAIGGE